MADSGQWDEPMVSSTSAGLRAEAAKARQPFRPARSAGLLSDRINCCRSIVEGRGIAILGRLFTLALPDNVKTASRALARQAAHNPITAA